MADEYKPNKQEILREMWERVKSSQIKEKLEYAINGGIISIYGIHAGPTVRRLMTPTKEELEEAKLKSYKHQTILMGGVVFGALAQGAGYTYLVGQHDLAYLLIPLSTNVLSGAYEIGRSGIKLFNDSKQRLLQRHNSQRLEQKVE